MNEKLQSVADQPIEPFEQWGKPDPTLLKYTPDFFVITPPRSGSTWLFENLRCHPEIFIPLFKEVKYFNAYWKMCDINWYLECFKEGRDKKKGDVSPSYAILTDDMLQSIKHIIPNLHIIIIFRDPIERSWSHAKHQFRFKESVFASFNEIYENVPESKIIDCLTNTWMMAYSDYLSILRRWAAIFPKENIYVNFFDSIISTPQSLLENVFQHIGASKDIDWLKLPLHERFFQGIEQEVPVKIKNILLSLYHARMKEFANYLLDVFGLKIPESWNYIIDTGVKNKELYKSYFSNDNNQVILDDILTRESIQSIYVQLLKEDYKGFKIIAFKGECLAISKVLDGIDIVHTSKANLECNKRDGSILCCDTLNEAMNLIDEIKGKKPILIKEGYKGFNIVLHGDKYYALSQGLGSIDFTWLEEQRIREYQKNGKCFIANSLSVAKTLVDQLTDSSAIKLIEEGYRGFNIVLYGNKYHTLSQDLGRIDFTTISEAELLEYRNKGKYIIGNSHYEAKHYVDEIVFQYLRNDIEDKNKEIDTLHKDISSKNTNIELLNKEILEREVNINKLNEDIGGCRRDIQTLREDILSKENNMEFLKGDILKRDEDIKGLKQELSFIQSKWWFKLFKGRYNKDMKVNL